MRRSFVSWSLLLVFSCANDADSKLFWMDWSLPRKIQSFFSFPGRYTPLSQKRNVRDSILKRIETAEVSIDLWIYSFDDPEILAALQRAAKRGITISIVADPDKDYPQELVRLGLFRRWERSGLQHSKILIVDRKTVFLGSGNFTWYGLENDLNGYVSFDLFETERESFYSFLEEDPGIDVLEIPPFQFYISPEKGRLIQNLILRDVDSSKESVRYLIFDHFDSVLTSRLAYANRRGVSVQGVYDSPVDEEGKFLANAFDRTDSKIFGDGNEETISGDSFGKGGLLHHKTMLIDGKILLSGSYNFSVSARDSNREILFRTTDASLVEAYSREWDRVAASAIRFQPTVTFDFLNAPSSLASTSDAGSDSFSFGFPENAIPVGFEQTLCRSNTFSEESVFFESGAGFFRMILEYSYDPGETCKVVSDFSAASSGFTGKRTNHPVKTRNFRKNSSLRTKKGNTLLTTEKEDSLSRFESKPTFLFVPKYFSTVTGNLFLPDEPLRSGKFPNLRAVLLYQRGNGPVEISWTAAGNIFSAIPHQAEGMLFLEYDNAFLGFCFHEYSKKGMEYSELIPEMLSYRESVLKPNLRFSFEADAMENRRNWGTYCYRY
ncbi:phospholipase D-like domain-containing protein [Leptospira sp. FAT2]|uniref:phospholipase D-like domain-containing protein n=1 Tax=Leptospira sanjuanensis TaxID=2879643 RepID=UPI001EE9387A|nr:phospholipase D-like domain-containing protein [Leptospira sanjuanensis]MCG6193352.1 phospholipase D-like domain-containing protein [Leptospira sanjuanensis]